MTRSPTLLKRPTLMIALSLATAFLLAGCTNEAAQDDPLKGIDGEIVRIPGTHYDPASLVIPAGTTVTWINDDTMHEHTVTPTDKQRWGSEGSGDGFQDWLRNGETWSYTFTEPGTYEYICIPHAWQTADGWQGQVGTITVEET